MEVITLVAETKGEAKKLREIYLKRLIPYANLCYSGHKVMLNFYPAHYVKAECPACGQQVLKTILDMRK